MKSVFLLPLLTLAFMQQTSASPPVHTAKDLFYRQLCRCTKDITHTNGGTYTLILTYEVSSNTTCGNWEGASAGWLIITFMGLPVVEGPPSQYAFENICGPNTAPTAKK